MNRVRPVTITIACSLSLLGTAATWAADPVDASTSAQPPATSVHTVGDRVTESTPVKGDLAPPKPTEVQKTKTRSNQSNDRQATPTPVKDDTATEQPVEVVKTKTKSNQSND